MTPAELARIRRIVELRAAQLRLAESAHARDAAASERARQEETDALQAVDDAADAASVSGRAGTAIEVRSPIGVRYSRASGKETVASLS